MKARSKTKQHTAFKEEAFLRQDPDAMTQQPTSSKQLIDRLRLVSRQAHSSLSQGNFHKLKLLLGAAIIVSVMVRVLSKLNDILQGTQFASQISLTGPALGVIK